MGSIGQILGESQAAHPETEAQRGQDIPATQGRRAQADGQPQGLLRHHVRASDRHPVEGASEGVRQFEQRARVFQEMGGGGLFPEAVEEGAGGVRRDGGDSLEVAEHRRQHGEGAACARVGRAEPDRPGKKWGPSGTSSWTRVVSRCRLS